MDAGLDAKYPDSTHELFATGPVQVAIMGPVAHITIFTTRPTTPSGENQVTTAQYHRAIVARLVVPVEAAADFAMTLNTVLKTSGAMPGGPRPVG